MPKPVYIVCAHQVVEDKTTNLVSIFNVIERIVAHRTPPGIDSGGLITVTLDAGSVPGVFGLSKTIAVWTKEPGDDGVEFESDFFVKFGSHVDAIASPSTFEFAADKPLKRFTLTMHGFPMPDATCIATITSRIRRVGETEWLSQSYPIPVEIIEHPAAVTSN